MQRLLLVLLLCPLTVAAQSNLNDLDGDGCVGATDILVILGQYGECNDSTAVFACGDSVLFDSYWYETVLIGDQCWFAENLRTTVYVNGDLIPAGLTGGEWNSTTAGATAFYANEASSLEDYGRLYNWYAVNDMRGLCPSNWHVPSDEEFMTLEMELGMSETDANSIGWYRGLDEGAQLKASASDTPSWNGTNASGFHGLSGGQRFGGGSFGDDPFCLWWSGTDSSGSAWTRILSSTYLTVKRDLVPSNHGLSVRCLQDTPPLQGCTDSSYIEYNPSAELDDGSCLTPVAAGCTDSLYVEFDLLANVDDGSCSTLASTCSEVEMDGYSYSTVLIGDQCWFAENLRTTVYTDGTVIPAGLTDSEWASTTLGATAVYGEGGSTCEDNSPDIDACDEAQSLAEYGRLYNWYAIDDARGLCPTGWHVPTDGEWMVLEMELGMSESEANSTGPRGTDEGTKLKSTYGWEGGNNGTDDFGFTGLPGGYRYNNYDDFDFAGRSGNWWSSSPSGGNAWFRRLFHSSPAVARFNIIPQYGFSVRCLKDLE